ncbi:MAG: NAD(P)-dependent oxidoreductase [Saprospiraceae bacterium]|nr:NAD(P)-dependent oxidoreductase [Saprospiraceae bacterium]
MSEKVLITGASGFVGGFLVEEALNRDLDVYAAVRPTGNKEYLTDPRIKFLNLDFENVQNLAEVFNSHQFDYLIHNAGLKKSPRKEDYFKVNAEYLNNIIHALQSTDTSLKKITFVSSLAAYGPAEYTETGIVMEDSTPHPVTNYGRSKLKGEHYLQSQDSLPYVIIRPTAVYGPREKDLFTMYQFLNKRLDISVGLEDQKLTFIYVKDLVRVILDSTLAHKKNVAYFATDLEVHTSSSYNKAILKALGNKLALKLKLPITVMKVLGFASEKLGSLFGQYPALNVEKVNELEANSWICDTTALVKDLNYKPQYDLERGLAESIAWYKEKNWLK